MFNVMLAYFVINVIGGLFIIIRDIRVDYLAVKVIIDDKMEEHDYYPGEFKTKLWYAVFYMLMFVMQIVFYTLAWAPHKVLKG